MPPIRSSPHIIAAPVPHLFPQLLSLPQVVAHPSAHLQQLNGQHTEELHGQAQADTGRHTLCHEHTGSIPCSIQNPGLVMRIDPGIHACL